MEDYIKKEKRTLNRSDLVLTVRQRLHSHKGLLTRLQAAVNSATARSEGSLANHRLLVRGIHLGVIYH